MKKLTITLNLTDDLKVKSIVFEENETGIKSDSELLNNAATAILSLLKSNKDDIEVQELLNDLQIPREL